MNRAHGLLACAAVALLLTGCLLGPGTTRTTRLFVLNATTTPAGSSDDASDLRLGIGRILLPEFLNRPQTVTRTGGNRVRMADFSQWAEPLEKGIPRVLSENLARLTGTDRVSVYPWPTTIEIDLTLEIHKALEKYGVSGAQHGTSGNNSDRLRQIASKTTTTKANVATALQMISWGLEVNDYGNAIQNENGAFLKLVDEGVTEDIWAEMVAYAEANGIKGGNFKKLNLPFENILLGQSKEVRERMVKRVEDFVYGLLTEVFNAEDTAPLALEAILEAGSHDLGPKAARMEDPADWTEEKIRAAAAKIDSDKGAEGDFDD